MAKRRTSRKRSSASVIDFNSLTFFLFVVFVLLASMFLVSRMIGVNVLGSSTSTVTCTPTGFFRDSINMTAALVNPTSPVTGDVNATGCNIGVYFSQNGSVNNANVYGANYFGVLVNGDHSNVSVDVKGSKIHDIGETPLNGTQHGVAVYYRAFLASGSTRGKISNNDITNYQKGGIVTNGVNTSVIVDSNVVRGQGPVGYIAQNGIQVGYGAKAQVMRNYVSGNSYTGTSTVSGGIIVVGGPGYGTCPNGSDCPYTTGTVIEGNTVSNNDVGVWLTNIDASGNSPLTQTNAKAVNNTISNDGLHNNYGGAGYQAGVADQGNNDKIISNNISGAGYNPATSTTAFLVAIDADKSFTNKPKVHANVINP